MVQCGADPLLNRRLASGAAPRGAQLPQGLQTARYRSFHRKSVSARVQQLAGTLCFVGERDLRIGWNVTLAQATVVRSQNEIAARVIGARVVDRAELAAWMIHEIAADDIVVVAEPVGR